ncbi:hypothetical protein HDU97_002566 [Phlyctochytrium planicorne]|nr:hypothetical protein HDU97_002566 [Phlyctochytrium planicorne]
MQRMGRDLSAYTVTKACHSLLTFESVRGEKLLQTTDPGFEAFSPLHARCMSPYLTKRDLSSSYQESQTSNQTKADSTLRIYGFRLDDRNCVKTELDSNDTILVQNVETLSPRLIWANSPKAQDALRSFREGRDKPGGPKWVLLKYNPMAPFDDQDLARSVTPTLDDPYSQRHDTTLNSVSTIELVQAGFGSWDSCVAQIKGLDWQNTSESSFFLLYSDIDGTGHKPQASIAPTISFFPISIFALSPEGYMDDVVGSKTPESGNYVELNLYDVFWMFHELDSIIFEYSPIPMALFRQQAPIFKGEALHVMPIPEHQQMSSDCFVEDGVYEEWLAHDHDTSMEAFQTGKRRLQRKNMMPITPSSSLKDDIFLHLFEDIWAEVMPNFEAFLEVGETVKSRDIAAQQASGDGFSYIEHLLEAITIRPVPLQKRDLSARLKTTAPGDTTIIEQPSQYIRPDSARPMSGRTFQRPSSTRPSSARIPDHGVFSKHNAGSIVSKTLTSGLKRVSFGTKLTPLGLLPGVSNFSEGILGTSIGLVGSRGAGSNSTGWDLPRSGVSNLGKRLPPLRSSMMASIQEALNETLSGVTPSGATKPVTKKEEFLAGSLQTTGSRHVVFEATENLDQQKAVGSMSPRPYSARRQSSGGIRHKTMGSRPQTTMDESRVRKLDFECL